MYCIAVGVLTVTGILTAIAAAFFAVVGFVVLLLFKDPPEPKEKKEDV